MKTIYLVRHAKSSWNNPDLSDEERPLLEKGKKRTKKIIDYLMDKNVMVDLLISSHAVRAQETARIIGKALKYPQDKIRIERSIYASYPDSILDLLYDIPSQAKSVMLVGHNPSMTDIANMFLRTKTDYLPTSAVVCLQFDIEQWEEVHTARPQKEWVAAPKAL